MPEFGRSSLPTLYTDNIYLDRANRDIRLSRDSADVLLLSDTLKMGANINLAQYELLNAYPALMGLFRQGLRLPIPSQAAWRSSNTNSGTFNSDTTFVTVGTGATASSRGLGRAETFGLAEGANYADCDFDKAILFTCALRRSLSDTEVNAYCKYSGDSTHGDVATKGFGWKMANLTLTGQAYGSELAATATLATLTSLAVLVLHIVHIPTAVPGFAAGVYYFNRSTQLASITAANSIPTGKTSSVAHNVVVSILNGATGGVAAVLAAGQLALAREA